MSFTATYCRYHINYDENFETFEEAKKFLEIQSEEGELYPISIVDNKTKKVIWENERFLEM